MSLPRLKHLRIHGPMSVLPVTEKVPRRSILFLIMGPTGAGKSSFIEALAGDSHGLKISGNQLASVTQSVTAYHLVNVTRRDCPVYIIDTPGFSDSKISEGEIIGMVNRWREDNDDVDIDHILFLIPITATRIEGTKRRTLEMTRDLMGEHSLRCMTFVTTMWDQVANKSAQQRAESNFRQLEKVVLKNWIRKGARLTRFDNEQASALEAFDRGFFWYFDFSHRPALLYHDLHERISTALQEKQMIEGELNNPNNTNNPHLNALLKQNHADNEDLLLKFICQLQEEYEMPIEDYEVAHAELTAAISALGDDLLDMNRRVQERCELECQRFARESKLGFRVLRKIEHAKTSFTDILKRTSWANTRFGVIIQNLRITDKGANMAKFKNTRSSALEVLDVSDMTSSRPRLQSYVYYALQKGIENALSATASITTSLAACDGQSESDDLEHRLLNEKQYSENEARLNTFLHQIASLSLPREELAIQRAMHTTLPLPNPH